METDSCLRGFLLMLFLVVCVNATDSEYIYKCDEENSEWTRFFDIDSPSRSIYDGDFETLEEIKKIFPHEVCDNPTGVDPKLTNGQSVRTSYNSFTLSLKGLVCYNIRQRRRYCADFKIRFCCPKKVQPTVPDKPALECDGIFSWSEWLDFDDPHGEGDSELLSIARKRKPKLCEKAVNIDFRPVSLETESPDDKIHIIPYEGIECLNEKQKDGKCEDYEIRFCCPTEYVEPECDGRNEWTVWYNRDNPDNYGDVECLQLLRSENKGDVCKNPSSIEAQVVKTEKPYYFGNDVVTIGRGAGLTCVNSEQEDGSCEDYRVRYCCPKFDRHPVCGGENEWSQWIDTDDPNQSGDNGDYELLNSFRLTQNLCSFPTSIEGRVKSTGVNALDTTTTLTRFTPTFGLACDNSAQEVGTCEDFEVRFCCPRLYVSSSGCDGDNSWTSFYDIDNPDPGGDIECLYLHRFKNPNDNICKDPSRIEVQQTSGSGSYLNQIAFTDVTPYGFNCNSFFCQDYRVRYCCPLRYINPSCAGSNTWTDFRSVDTSDGIGDIEPPFGCDNPTSIDAALISTGSGYTNGGDFVELSPSEGLSCINEQQFDGSCENYKVRFCCP